MINREDLVELERLNMEMALIDPLEEPLSYELAEDKANAFARKKFNWMSSRPLVSPTFLFDFIKAVLG